MPTGTYDIENFLVYKLNDLGVSIAETDKDLFTKAVKNTIGYNPRSLKRYLNSFSLINHLRLGDVEDEDQCDDFILFALLGIQISYPKVFRLLTQKSNFIEWDRQFASKQGLEWDEIQEKIKKFGESSLIDEEWEQVLWGACQSDPFLKSKSFTVLELLNLIRDKYGNSLEDEIDSAMTFAAITSVDDDLNTKQSVQKIGNKTIFNGIENKINQLTEEGFNEIAVENWRAFWEVLSQKSLHNSNYRVSFAKSGCGFYDDNKGGKGKNQLFYSWNPSKKSLGLKIFVKKNTGIIESLYSHFSNEYPDLINNLILLKNDDLILEPDLYNELGVKSYTELLRYLAEQV